ncbi:hypothetical protein CORC01_00309 [Colletotrichum orchidophilum]|uniref:Uncharacterized protein n=1 Tax=Colletotrichum orchidophilum TaxID=1209926 RepID=A0A1G4BT75_9PEZI|nr:uncharacterized protein CORC01_00309 [Colletotrichum orchidophilum]OHF04457.1 hypothetical protein CORC01_00309 [Colletotrichum orchidophilum]
MSPMSFRLHPFPDSVGLSAAGVVIHEAVTPKPVEIFASPAVSVVCKKIIKYHVCAVAVLLMQMVQVIQSGIRFE